jgi:hypothetical protein
VLLVDTSGGFLEEFFVASSEDETGSGVLLTSEEEVLDCWREPVLVIWAVEVTYGECLFSS